MKRISYIFLILLLSSCHTRLPVYKNSFSLDYQPYLDKGFFLTDSDTADFDYRELSLVIAVVRSGAGDRKKDQTVSPKHAVDMLYKEAIAKGADGIINLKIDPFLIEVLDKGVGITSKIGFKASGVAIKR